MHAGLNPFEGCTPSVPHGEKLDYGGPAFQEYEALGNTPNFELHLPWVLGVGQDSILGTVFCVSPKGGIVYKHGGLLQLIVIVEDGPELPHSAVT